MKDPTFQLQKNIGVVIEVLNSSPDGVEVHGRYRTITNREEQWILPHKTSSYLFFILMNVQSDPPLP